jgi:stage III sporulation protein SpoIIIAA
MTPQHSGSAIRQQNLPGIQGQTADGLVQLLDVLPVAISQALATVSDEYPEHELTELVLDLGRRPEARYRRGQILLTEEEVTRQDLAYVADRLGRFGDDNRAGIERTLHRISAIRNRSGEIVGLTCRVGRAVFGTIGIIKDLVETGESILLLGRPGVGKTTMLREMARVVADDLGKRVVIVDTSNEIGGDGDIPHPAIGRARRMQVPTPSLQHSVMIEAVENHMPEVIVIDEIGTELEAAAARTIAERGVQLIGTAHGNTLENLMLNPTLSDLVGGIQSVTLSDEEARRRGTQKSVLERKAPPTFASLVEIQEQDRVAVILNVAEAVDALLRDLAVHREIRERQSDGTVDIFRDDGDRRVVASAPPASGSRRAAPMERPTPSQPLAGPSSNGHPVSPDNPLAQGRGTTERPLRIFPFGVSRNRLEQAVISLGINANIVRDQREADMVLTLRNYYRQRPRPLREAEARGTAIYVLRSNTVVQMTNLLRDLLREVRPDEHDFFVAAQPVDRSDDGDEVTDALYEAEEAIHAIMSGSNAVELRPQSTHVRRLQHELADRYNLGSRSLGKDPNRRVELFRNGSGGS